MLHMCAINKFNLQYFIKNSEFIMDNLMKNLFSFSLNHYTKYIYKYLSNEIYFEY